MFCLRRRPEITHDEFLARWRGRHAEIASRAIGAIGAIRYVQNHALHGPLSSALRASRGAPEPYDGVVELWFDSVEAVESTFARTDARAAIRELVEDEVHFIDVANSPIFVAKEHVVWEAPA